VIPFAALVLVAQMATPPAQADAVRIAPPIAFAPPPDAAVIENSGSTNFAGYRIAVSPNGSALYAAPGGVRRGRVTPATARWLFRTLRENAPLSALGGTSCMKSVSFGTSTTIAWHGERSADLSCGGSPGTVELTRTIGVIEKQLDVVPAPGNRRYKQ
jgi:hypothetical protein